MTPDNGRPIILSEEDLRELQVMAEEHWRGREVLQLIAFFQKIRQRHDVIRNMKPKGLPRDLGSEQETSDSEEKEAQAT